MEEPRHFKNVRSGGIEEYCGVCVISTVYSHRYLGSSAGSQQLKKYARRECIQARMSGRKCLAHQRSLKKRLHAAAEPPWVNEKTPGECRPNAVSTPGHRPKHTQPQPRNHNDRHEKLERNMETLMKRNTKPKDKSEKKKEKLKMKNITENIVSIMKQWTNPKIRKQRN